MAENLKKDNLLRFTLEINLDVPIIDFSKMESKEFTWNEKSNNPNKIKSLLKRRFRELVTR
jgi:hypothetical protein